MGINKLIRGVSDIKPNFLNSFTGKYTITGRENHLSDIKNKRVGEVAICKTLTAMYNV